MMGKILDFFFELAKTVILALIVVVPIRLFLFQPFVVMGQSMEPNFENGDYLIVDELTYRLRSPERGEVVVFKLQNKKARLIKRIIGLPNEEIEISNGKIKIKKEGKEFFLDESKYLSQDFQIGNFKFSLKENEYFVLGDNRLYSLDSRSFGPIKREQIVGRVILRLWPPNQIKAYFSPVY